MNVDSWFDFINKSDPFLRIFKQLGNENTLVLETECIRNDLNPQWHQFSISMAKLCDDNLN